MSQPLQRLGLFILFLVGVAEPVWSQGYLNPVDSRQEQFEKWLDLQSDRTVRSEEIRSIRPYPLEYVRRLLQERPKVTGADAWVDSLRLQLDQTTRPSWSAAQGRLQARTGARVHASASESPATRTLEVQAVNLPLLDGREGLFYQDGLNNAWMGEAALSWRQAGDLGGWGFTLAADPSLRLSENETRYQENGDLDLRRAYAIFHANQLQIEAGKNSVLWGVGRLGNLAFAGNNEPLQIVRVRNSTPVLLPGFLSALGPTVAEAWTTQLDGDQVLANSWLLASKVAFKPLPGLEISPGYVVQFGGKGSGTNNPLLYFGEKLFGENNGASNRNLMLETRYRFESLNIEPYLQLYWEDCCDEIVLNRRDVMNLFGLYMPRVDAAGKLDLTFEWARTNFITYRHGAYRSGFEYRGRVLGHSVGPDGLGVYGRARYWWSADFWSRLQLAFEERGYTERAVDSGFRDIRTVDAAFEAPERRFRLDSRINYRLPVSLSKNGKGCWLEGDLGYEHIQNADYVRFRSGDNWLAGISLAAEF